MDIPGLDQYGGGVKMTKEKLLKQAFILCDELCFTHAEYERTYNLYLSLANNPPITDLDADIYSRLGNLNRFWLKLPLAKKQLKIAINLNPNHWFAHFVFIRTLVANNKSAQAHKHYAKLNIPVLKDIRILHQKIAAEAALKLVMEGRKTCAYALKISPNDPGVLYTQGVLENNADCPKKAIAALTKALKFRPNHAPSLVERGKAYAKIGKLKLASKDFFASQSLEKNYASLFDYSALLKLTKA